MTLVEKFDLEREYRLYCMNKKRKGILMEIIPAFERKRESATAPGLSAGGAGNGGNRSKR